MTARPIDSGTATPRPADPTTTKPHILLVDDESVVSRSVAKLIERIGYQVTVADSGAAALELARRIRFDIVLTDQHMPGMSGAELIAALVNHVGIPRDRIILTSGDLEAPETEELSAEAGCRYLEKPFHIHDLAQALTSIVPPVRATRPA
jgi:two-component system, chemotaxis family, chemotaxis protein CheY